MRTLRIIGNILIMFPLWPIFIVRLMGWAITGACDLALARCTYYHEVGDRIAADLEK